MNETKICNVCGEEKELTEFYSEEKTKTNGEAYIYHRPDCKECTKKRSRTWFDDHPEERKQFYKTNNKKPKVKKRVYEYSKRRRENGSYAKWQKDNPDKISGYNKERNLHKKHEISKKEWENCKNYFNYRCAYCGLAIEDHWVRYKGNVILGDFHKEHVEDKGANDLSNCIPACKSCNGSKHIYELSEWYNENNPIYSIERLNKIYIWLESDHKKYIKVT